MNEALEEMISTFIWKSDPHSAVLGLIHAAGDENMGHLLLDASEKFVELFKHEYDLVIVDEIFTIHGMTITKILKEISGIPYIVFTTSNVGAESNVAEFSMGHTPVIDATHGTILPSGHGDIYDPKIFWLRVYNFLEAFGEYAMMYNYSNLNTLHCIILRNSLFLDPLVVKYQNPGKLMTFSFSTHEINRMAEMNLRDSLDRLGRIAPIAEDFRGIGSHCKKAEKLSKEFSDFAEDSTSKGTIYIAFGSIVNFDRCPQFVFDAFFKALNQFPDYRIIFSMKKLKSRSIPKLNSHVKLVHWAPQLAILNHKKTVLFMSHGGLKSYKEALCTKVPVVFLPILAEQGSIARMSMKMGIGTSLSKYTLTAEKIVEAFNRVLHDKSYKSNMEKINYFFLDRIITSLDEGAWYVNKIIKRSDKLGKRSASLPNNDRSLLFFRRKGISFNSFNFFGFDWIIAFVFFSFILSK
uniref:UDP-glucuronosyltransferase n=1 Tax=Panagrolaimus sp. ES5 TaxID=591445 RepID=A0AC34FIU8_9BILA